MTMTRNNTTGTRVAAIALLGAALCGLGSTAAQAQTATDSVAAVKPLTIKLGAFLPTNGKLKNAIGNTWFSTGAEYTFNQSGGGDDFLKPAVQNVLPLVYVDYAGLSQHGLKANYVGVGAGVRSYFGQPGTGEVAPYAGAGIGAYFLHASGFGSSSDKTQAGFRLLLGVEFQQEYVLEAGYTNAGSSNGVRFDGVNLQAGVRF